LTDREGTLTEDPAQPRGAEGLPFQALQNLFNAFHKGLILRRGKVQLYYAEKPSMLNPVTKNHVTGARKTQFNAMISNVEQRYELGLRFRKYSDSFVFVGFLCGSGYVSR
jgi:hypothetical protein